MEVGQIPEVLAASSSLRVIEIDPQTDLRWEAWLASVPACPSPVYHPEWLKVREEAYGLKPKNRYWTDLKFGADRSPCQ